MLTRYNSVPGYSVITMLNGDLFQSHNSLVHCVSEDFKMGAGIAVQFKKKFGGVDELKKQNKKVGECAYLKRDGRYIFYLITKEKYWMKPTYEMLQLALGDMKKICKEKRINKISMPKIGCGLDRLYWDIVKEMIAITFRNMEEVSVYYL